MSAKRRIFLDTNILLDVLLEREAFYYDTLKIWSAVVPPGSFTMQ